jgi:predicted PurR-regulated permease PerM/phosphoglycolate phosphatase-like HAD superfamily hydrolase
LSDFAAACTPKCRPPLFLSAAIYDKIATGAGMNTRWSPFFKQLVIVVALVFTVWLIARTIDVITPLVLAMLLAYVVSLAVDRFTRDTHWPRTPVVLISELVIVLLILTVPALITPWLVTAAGAFINTLANVSQELLQATPRPITIAPSLTIDLGPYYQPINEWLRSIVGPDLGTIQNLQGLQNLVVPVASGAAGVVKGAVSGVVSAFLTLVIAFYVVRDGPHIGERVSGIVPEPWRTELGKLWDELAFMWDAFVRGQISLAFIVGIVIWLAMTILGVPNAPMLGLISGLLEFVPAIGPVIAAIPGIAFALFLGSNWLPIGNLWFAIIVALVYILVQQTENYYLLPRFVGRRVRLHPAVVIVGVLAGSRLFGVLGILLAAPTIAGLRVVAMYAFRKLFDEEPFPAAPPVPSRVALWPGLVEKAPVRAVIFDLDGTLLELNRNYERRIVERLRFLDPLVPKTARERIARRVMLIGETNVNWCMAVLHRWNLDGRAAGWEPRLRRMTGTLPAEDAAVVAGVPEMLQILARRYRLGIVTGRNKEDVQNILARCGLADQFSAVVARDDMKRLKPYRPPVQLAAEWMGAPLRECVVVSDTNAELWRARARGGLTAGVLCGLGNEDDFAESHLVLNTTAQLRTWL